MNKIMKIFTAAIAVAALLGNTVFASVLGSEQISGWSLELADGTYLHQNVFMSDQASVKEQTEYYCEYTPNENLRPVVINGSEIYGKRNILQAAEYMKDNGLQPMLGINADYFSFKTGVPMGHTIMNGELVTKDVTGQDAIGFNQDGSAFISWLEIQTTLTTDDQTIFIDNINKYRQPGAFPAFLLTDKFGKNTKASTWGIDVILGSVEGPMTIGGEVRAVVEDIGYNDGAIEIPEGKMVLTMDCNGYSEIYQQIQNLKIGQTVTIKNTAVYDAERWANADSGIGGIGGRLIENGTVKTEFEAGSAPRTAVGVKADGTVVFYVLDGRQTGYSYGAKIATIAKRMAELGCVDAINLDGGGSTTMAGIYPGSDILSVINSPSEGSLRSVANFIFLQNTKQPTGQIKKLYPYPYTGYYLNGMTQKLEIKAVDTANYPIDAPNDITYSAYHTETSVLEGGTVAFAGDGETVITAESPGSGVYGQAKFITYRTPTDIIVKNEADGNAVSAISGTLGQQINLTATAYAGRNVLQSVDTLYKWEIAEGDFGTIDENGLLVLGTPGASGKIRVSAGDFSKEIPVSVRDINESEKHPKITVSVPEDQSKIVAVITSNGGPLSASAAIVKIDGVDVSDTEKVEKNQTGTYDAQIVYHTDSSFFDTLHKVTFQISNQAGYTGIYSAGFGTPDSSREFEDTDGHWADSVIGYMGNKGIINGINENGKRYFKPNALMTRAEFAVMMTNYLGIHPEDYQAEALPFADYQKIPAWAENAVKAMYKTNVIKGKEENGTVVFAPQDNITRAEVVTILSRIMPAGLYQADLGYIADYTQIPAWASGGFSSLCGAGLLTGYEDNTLRPNNPITRAEALKMVYNIL